DSDDADARPWGLVAEKRLLDLDGVAQRLQDLQTRVQQARRGEKEFEPIDQREARAGRALRFELFGYFVKAKEEWSRLKSAEVEAGERGWFLLAAFKVAETTPKVDADILPKGRALVRQKLKEAAQLKDKQPDQAAIICRDILFLYDKDSEMADETAQANALLPELLSGEKPKSP